MGAFEFEDENLSYKGGSPDQSDLATKDKILIADDSPDALNLMRKALEAHGYEVATVTSGTACIDAFINSNVQLCLIDFVMPDQDGIETVRKLREYRTSEELPIILVTQMHDKDLVIEAVKSGVNDFIMKPIRPLDFCQRIERFLVKLTIADIVKILLSMNVSDPSNLDVELRKNILNQNLASYPFKIGEMNCCAILERSKDPHSIARLNPDKISDHLVMMAKSGVLWNVIWPRHRKAKFSLHLFPPSAKGKI